MISQTETILDIKAYDHADIPDTDSNWLWGGYLAKGNLTVLAAPPKCGKSTLLSHLFVALRDGGTFLRQDVNPTEGIVFSEEPIGLWAQRRELHGELPITIVSPSPDLTWSKVLAFSRVQAEKGCEFAVIDTVSSFWGVEDENDSSEVNEALDPLLQVCRTADLAALVVHHTRKTRGAEGSAVRGSNAILATADIGLEMSRMSPYDRGTRRRLESFAAWIRACLPRIMVVRRATVGAAGSDRLYQPRGSA